MLADTVEIYKCFLWEAVKDQDFEAYNNLWVSIILYVKSHRGSIL